MRVVISGWSGSSNLGDELVLGGLLRLLEGHQAAVISIDPGATRARFGVPAVAPRQTDRLVGAIRTADLLVLGGGGLLQDETSPYNLPYHLLRPAVATLAGTPVVGVGLGAGPLTRPGSRALVGQLARAVAVSVRDEPSRRLLADVGVTARTGADLALALDAPRGTPEDVITVSLRPWAGGGGWRPVGARRCHVLPTQLLEAAAVGLDELSAATGWPVRFVALQADRDDAVHAEVASRMRAPSERRRPGVHDVVEEIAAGRQVVAMRYHAGIAAVLGARPVALLGYSPKVDALAQALGPGAALLALSPPALRGLAGTVAALDRDEARLVAARERLRRGLDVDRAVLAAGLAAVGRH